MWVFFCLQAYSVYDEEIGYCQGQSFLAAVLLLHVSIHDLNFYYSESIVSNSIIIAQHTHSLYLAKDRAYLWQCLLNSDFLFSSHLIKWGIQLHVRKLGVLYSFAKFDF